MRLIYFIWVGKLLGIHSMWKVLPRGEY